MIDILLASVRACGKATPGIFGSRRGLSRFYAMIDIAATSGMTVGLPMAGFLQERFAYTSMNWVFDK